MLIQGLILGFSLAVPVGTIGLLCIQRTLSRGRLHGFVSGLGVATADSCYGLVAAFSLSAATSFLLGLQGWLQLAGGFFLEVFGYRITRTSPGIQSVQGDQAPGLLHAWFSMFMLTLANQATIMGFLAAFVALGLGLKPRNPRAACLLVIGVFVGSSAWWLVLCLIAGLVRAHLTDRRMRFVH